MFKPKGTISIGNQRSRWSIPCCISLNRGGAIQLQDDSDMEDEPFIQEPSYVFNQSTENLSRNPFARAPDTDRQMPVIEQEFSNSGEERNEELADFSQVNKRYEDESDWEEQESINEIEQEEVVKDRIEELVEIEAIVTVKEDDEIELEDDQKDILESISKRLSLKDETEDKIPQIDKDVLHMLPLPELSAEIPPTMIHQDEEESKYSELPLMSTSLNSNKNRISRFSMTEEEYLAFKEAEKQNKIPQELKAFDQPIERRGSSSSHTPSISNDALPEKFTYIKKNMSLDLNEEDNEEVETAEQMLKIIKEKNIDTSTRGEIEKHKIGRAHRRSSSLMSIGSTITKFMDQITLKDERPSDHSPTQSLSSSFTSSGLFSVFTSPDALPSTRPLIEEELVSTVMKIGKNVKIFGEGVVDNSKRVFNEIITSIENVEDEDSSRKNSISSTTDENEWMHNYL